MASAKFDEADRRRCVAAVEKCFGVSLQPEKLRRKWLRDGLGRSYWIIGGYGEWHGIPEEMIDAAARSNARTILAVAARAQASMHLYAGDAAQLVLHRDKLYRARQTTGDYQFTYRIRGDALVIDQVPNAILPRIASIPYGAEQKAHDKDFREAEKAIASLSDAERVAFLKSLAVRAGSN